MPNTLHHSKPHLIYEWDFIKNSELKLNYFTITKGSNKRAWWICPKCKSSYDMQVSTKNNRSGCPYCSGYRVNHTNCLSTVFPELASEWHPTSNGDRTPSNTYCRTTRKFWWLGKCGHEWETILRNRVRRGDGCPYCSGRKAIKGLTDIATTSPDVANLLLNKEESYILKEFSEVKTDWKCLCGHIIKKRTPKSVSLYGLGCPACSDGKSFAEKFMGNILAEYYSSYFETEKTFEWLDNRRYDFYLPEHSIVIEVHGEQHYRESPSFNKTLKEMQAIDKLKKDMAIDNGLEYIEIDTTKTYLAFLKESINRSGILSLLSTDEIDWNEMYRRALKPMQHTFLFLYDKGLSIKEITYKMKISNVTAYRYMSQCMDAGLIKGIEEDGSLLLQSDRIKI